MVRTHGRTVCTTFRFCSENGPEPLNADDTSGAEFLPQHFRKSSCEFSSVKAARSALSSILLAVNGFTLAEKPLIKKFLWGMFKKNPAFPHCTVPYDVKYVLD